MVGCNTELKMLYALNDIIQTKYFIMYITIFLHPVFTLYVTYIKCIRIEDGDTWVLN